MSETVLNLPGLLGARLCHDLVSPLGAIANGLELLEMSGIPMSPELQLIADSSQAANDRLKFYRLAFGRGGTDQDLSPSTIHAALRGGSHSPARLAWPITAAVSRRRVQLVFLLMLCADTVLRKGARIEAELTASGCTVRGYGPVHEGHQTLLSALESGAHWPQDLDPARVHFPLARLAAHDMGERIRLSPLAEGIMLETHPRTATHQVSSEQPHLHPQDI